MNIVFKNYILLDTQEHIKLLNIRNQEYIRNNMTDTKIIELKNHLQWIQKLKNDKNNTYYAVYLHSKLEGGVSITNVDFKSKSSYWGLFFNKSIHPFLSSFSAYLIIDKIFNELELDNLILDVNKNNTNTLKFDANLGFKPLSEHTLNKKIFVKMAQKKSDWTANKKNSLLSIIYKKLQSIEYKFIEKV